MLTGVWPVFRKEMIHLSRDPTALFFALFIPVLQLLLIGFAIDMNVRNIRTAIFDAANTQESRRFIDRLLNTGDFRIVTTVDSDADLEEAIVAGKAKVGIKIPLDFSQKSLDGQTAQVLVLVDGSDSTVTGEAMNATNGVALTESLSRLLGQAGVRSVPVEVRPTVLFNPDTRTANFMVPGMIAIVTQMMVILLTAFSIVRERETGTLEQLTMTPIKPIGLMVGKMLPYLMLGFGEIVVISQLLQYVFFVPIRGSYVLLLAMSVPFLLTVSGLGLMISTRARTQAEAMQLAFGTLLPTIFLSGYIFAVDNMPIGFQYVSRLIPGTYFIDTLRGIILRGAGLRELWLNALVLVAMGFIAIAVAARSFSRATK